MDFGGKVVLITGASSGIGADAAQYLAHLGAKLSIVSRNKEGIEKVADQIRKSGAPTPLPIVADVTTDSERIVDETIKHFGQLDVLVNNAGIAHVDSACSIEMREFDRILDTNLRSVIKLTKACAPHLEKTKGNIVNVSSIDGISPIRNFTSYCVSKAALDQFTKCAALDLADAGIRVNSINPATIRTPIFETFMSPQEAEKVFESNKQNLVGRIGEVSDTSTAIGFLADNNLSPFITGILLPVDGGILVAGRPSTLDTGKFRCKL